MNNIDTRLEAKHVWTLDEVNAAIKRVKTEPSSVLVPHFNEMVAVQRPNNMLTQLYAIKCELLEKALEAATTKHQGAE